ncbi:hypothetical protein EMCRGX_G001828 [Ephydatia muelleri]
MDIVDCLSILCYLVQIALQTKSDAQTDNAYHQVGFVMVTPIAPMAPMEVLSLIAIVRQTNSDVVMDNASLQVHSVMAILNVLMEVTKFVAVNRTVNLFRCTNGEFIPASWQCDGTFQCFDGSDEINCNCTSNQVRCSDGPCIPSNWICGFYYCPFGTNGTGAVDCISAIRGTHNQPSSLHFASLALCFLPSLARAADPEDTPASIKWWHDVPEDQGIARTKCTLGSLGSVHTKPPFYGNFMDRCIKMYPAPVMVEQTARMMHVVRKQKAIVLGQHWRRFPTAD